MDEERKRQSLAVLLFLDAAKSLLLNEKWKRKIMSALILKVLHAGSAAKEGKSKEQHTKREAKGATTSSFVCRHSGVTGSKT
jgi:hypothetical protein